MDIRPPKRGEFLLQLSDFQLRLRTLELINDVTSDWVIQYMNIVTRSK
jgi:hypothetical protein